MVFMTLGVPARPSCVPFHIFAGCRRVSSSRINILRRPSVIYFYCNICSLNVYDDHFKPFLWPDAALAALHESQSGLRTEGKDMWVPCAPSALPEGRPPTLLNIGLHSALPHIAVATRLLGCSLYKWLIKCWHRFHQSRVKSANWPGVLLCPETLGVRPERAFPLLHA